MKTRNMSLCSALTFVIVAAFAASCSPVLYSTVGQNVPLFHEKGEVALSGSRGSTDHATGFSGNLAVAVTDKIAIISSLHSLSAGGNAGSGTYFEFGGGRFWHNPKATVVAELFGGVGFGTINNSPSGGTVKLSYVKPFIQPSIGISGKVCDLAFTPRLAWISYTSKSGFTGADAQSIIDKFYDEKKNTIAFEPGVTFRIGYKNVKLQAQYNYTTFTYNASQSAVDNEFVSIGLYMNFTSWWDTKR